ncbi:hypothetical protein Daus18300_009350 [Diaporthe australafricana]|uniref:Dcp1-like decapping family protein n=1 Tax=Diaporthe australafricana TaxID=127596 RepID=A0ABR3WES4_9PEZI
MGPSTPRRPQKQRNNPSSGGGSRPPNFAAAAQVSDPQSGAFYLQPPAQPQPQSQPNLPTPIIVQSQRENTIDEINLTVLKRYVPTIQGYTAMAHNATLFTWNIDVGGWEETGVKGPFFVCNQEQGLSSTGRAIPRACVFILNRSSPENAVFDLATIAQCELLNGQLLSAVTDSGEGLGFFIDMGKAQETWDAFSELWHNVRAAVQG